MIVFWHDKISDLATSCQDGQHKPRRILALEIFKVNPTQPVIMTRKGLSTTRDHVGVGAGGAKWDLASSDARPHHDER